MVFNQKSIVGVCSRSFSKNEKLRLELTKRYRNVVFNDSGLSLSGESLIEFLKDCDKAIIALEKIDKNILKCLPKLNVISKYGVGLDMLDLSAMRKYSVNLGWTGGVNKRSVSEMVVSLSISLLRKIPQANKDSILGNWRQHVGRQLSGKTFGIIGCGFIGKDLATILQAFDCKVLCHDILEEPQFYKKHDIQNTELEVLLKSSDIISIHLPLDNSTRNILNGKRLNLIKKDTILINLARGGLVDEYELKMMLREKRIFAAAFDVFENEPPTDMELLKLDNFFVTPHIGGSAEEAIMAMGLSAIEGLDNFYIP